MLWWTWALVLLTFAVPWQALFDFVSSLVPERTWRVNLSLASGRRRARFGHGLDWFNKLTFVDVSANAPAQLGATPESRSPRPLRPIHGLLVCLICLLMIRELPNGFGRFTSYSNTYASTADFDERNPIKPVDRLYLGFATPSAVEVFQGSNNGQLLADAIRYLSRDEPLPPSFPERLQSIRETLEQEYRDERGRVSLVRERTTFDWDTGRFTSGRRDVIGTLELSSMTFIAAGG